MGRVAMRTNGPSETMSCGRVLAGLLAPGDVVLLSGDLGAGKTQLTKGVAEGLGVREPVTSPTFNILLVHRGRIPLYHFDLYRLERAEELEDLDYFATIESDGVSLVEWGDRFAEAEPQDGLVVTLSIEGDTVRRIDVRPIGERGAELALAWAAAYEAAARTGGGG
jgi:tRNA threonylcarbamoyladenosine biosynthesis protein TsaE